MIKLPAKKKKSEKVDKRHRGRVRIGVDPSGKPIYKYVSGNTKTELEAARKEVEEQYVSGAYVRRDISFKEYAEKWLMAYKRDKSASTYETYDGALRTHLIPILGMRQMRAIMPTDLQLLLASHAGESESLINKIHLTLKQVFTKAAAEYVIDRNPALSLELPRGTVGERRALTENETDATLKAAASHEGGLLLYLLYYLGVRRGEALGLQWRDINRKDHTIRVQREVDFRKGGDDRLKTAESDRIIPIPRPLADILLNMVGPADSHIIAGTKKRHMCQSSYRRLWTKLMIAMFEVDPMIEHKPVPEYIAKKIQTKNTEASVLTAHYYRHNYATMLYAAGVPLLTARYWLGHKDIKTTADIYTHLDKSKTAKDAILWRKFFDGCQMVANEEAYP